MRCASLPFFTLAALLLAVPPLTAQCNQNCPDRRTISVNGAAVITADADLAIVRVGYKLYGPDAKTTYTSATEASNAIMQALVASGVSKSAIESTSQVLQHTPENEQYPINSPERLQHEFTAIQSWAIRVKPDEAAKTLNTAINAGANESGWIQWVVELPESRQAEAAAKAEADARATAERIAQASGVRLGQLVSIVENQGIGDRFGGNYGGGVISSLQSSQPLAINSRRVEFSSTIYAVFAIE
jgi:uncharacterized protein